MDKSRFIEVAPQVLCFGQYVTFEATKVVSLTRLLVSTVHPRTGELSLRTRMIACSGKWLIAHKLVQVILDDYGPDLLEAAEESDAPLRIVVHGAGSLVSEVQSSGQSVGGSACAQWCQFRLS